MSGVEENFFFFQVTEYLVFELLRVELTGLDKLNQEKTHIDLHSMYDIHPLSNTHGHSTPSHTNSPSGRE